MIAISPRPVTAAWRALTLPLATASMLHGTEARCTCGQAGTVWREGDEDQFENAIFHVGPRTFCKHCFDE